MRTLFLLRHAKSSWADPTLADHDRPLAPRGRRAASCLARHVESEPIRPALVLCSSARRARDTFEALKPALDHHVDVEIDDDLYGADAHSLLDRLRGVGHDAASVMIVGHNPGLHDLAVALAGDGDSAAIGQLNTKFPTGALATLDLGGTSWGHLGPSQAYLVSLVLPRQLP